MRGSMTALLTALTLVVTAKAGVHQAALTAEARAAAMAPSESVSLTATPTDDAPMAESPAPRTDRLFDGRLPGGAPATYVELELPHSDDPPDAKPAPRKKKRPPVVSPQTALRGP